MKAPSGLLSGFDALKTHIIDRSGLAYYKDKEGELRAKVDKRLDASGCPAYDAYLRLLSDEVKGPEEFDRLVTDLTIGETYFFRDARVFEGLRQKVFPEVVQRNSVQRKLRVWCAGCATGEEPYSLAIFMQRELGPLVSGWDIAIIGTDINRDFLARAHSGHYTDWSFRETPDETRSSCFLQQGKTWKLRPEFRNGVSFQYHNLARNPYPSLLHNLVAFDIILCRNVLIYFEHDRIRQILGRFRECLVEGGWLVVGHADHNVHLFRQYETVTTEGASFYRKWDAGSPSIEQAPECLMEEAPETGVRDREKSQTVPEPETQSVSSREPPVSAAPAGAPEGLLFPAASEVDTLQELINRGEWERAVRESETLLEKHRMNPLVHFYHGLILEQTGQIREAQAALKRALYLDRHFVLAHYHLGLMMQRTGNRDAARRSFGTVLCLLEGLDEEHILETMDRISAGQLKELAAFNLEVMERL